MSRDSRVRMPGDHRSVIQNSFKSFKEQIDLTALVFYLSENKDYLYLQGLQAAAGTSHEKGPLYKAVVSVIKGNQIGQLEEPATRAECCAAFNSSAESPQTSTLEIPEIKVIRSTKFIKADGKHLKLYSTRGRKRGMLVIFSYFKFQDNLEPYRNGVEVDCRMLERVFTAIGFHVIIRENLSEEETKACLESISLEGYESVFVVVSSHGYCRRGSGDTTFRTADGGYMLAHELVEYFNNENYPELTGVPKVFIFQMCRGKKLFPKRLLGVALDAATRARRDSDSDEPPHSRPYSDILIAYSTVPGYTSQRIGSQEQGSTWYMRALCDVFAARAHECHALELLALVDEHLRARGLPQTCTYENWGFNRFLYLHPGLFEGLRHPPTALLATAVLTPIVLIIFTERRLTPRLGVGQLFLTMSSFLSSLWRY